MQLGQRICLMFLNTKGGDVMTHSIILQWKKNAVEREDLKQQNFLQHLTLKSDPNIPP